MRLESLKEKQTTGPFGANIFIINETLPRSTTSLKIFGFRLLHFKPKTHRIHNIVADTVHIHLRKKYDCGRITFRFIHVHPLGSCVSPREEFLSTRRSLLHKLNDLLGRSWSLVFILLQAKQTDFLKMIFCFWVGPVEIRWSW